MATKKMAAKLDGTRLEANQKQRRLCFYNNLILLEFNVSYMERKHKIKFNKDMFAVPNKKGFEVVTHFLFSKLNEAIGEEEYRILFPVLDKVQAQEFRKACHAHLNKISQEDSGISFPQIVPSTFHSPGGERFYELYLAFSTYVVQKFTEKDGIVKLNHLPPLTSENQKVLPAVFQIRTNASLKRFIETQKIALDNHQKLKDIANKLTVVYRSYKQKLKDTQILLQEKIKQMSTSGDINVEDRKAVSDFEQDLLQKSKEQVEKVQKNWKLVENVLVKEMEYWEIVRTELAAESANKKYVLDGKEYILQLPSSDTGTCFSELKKRKLHMIYKDGKLCLISFIDMWITCLDQYRKIFAQGKLPKLPPVEHSMREALDTVTMNLNVSKSLSERIVLDILPAMKQNVQMIQSSAFSKLNAAGRDVKCAEDMLFCETSQMMEQLNLSGSEKNQPNVQSEQQVFGLGDMIQTASLKDRCSPKCKQSLFSMQENVLSSQEKLSSVPLDERIPCIDGVSKDAPTNWEPLTPEQDSLNLIISPLKEDTKKTGIFSENFIDQGMCDPHYLFGTSWAEEEILAATLPVVPLLDGESPTGSPY